MAFEPLAPPTLPAGIRKPTAAEIAEVTASLPPDHEIKVSDVVFDPNAPIVERHAIWPIGTACACLRNHKDGKPCGHKWKTRAAGKPAACPKCKQARWDSEPKQRKRKGK